MKIKKQRINNTFFRGFIWGSCFTLALVITVQGWDFLRNRWAQMPTGEEGGGIAGSDTAKPQAVHALPKIEFKNLSGKPSQGPENAPILIVEFSDFQCPFCRQVGPILDRVVRESGGNVRRVWRHFPLEMHPAAFRMHVASECANAQGKFWEYREQVNSYDGNLSDEKVLMQLADAAGVNKKDFEKCLSENRYADKVMQDISEGQELGVRATPAIFINGRLYSGARPFEHYRKIIDNELKQNRN